MSQQQPKEDEEEEDEEQGEPFEFEDSADEEVIKEDVQLSRKEESNLPDDVAETTTKNTEQPVRTTPPAEQEADPTKDAASVSTAGTHIYSDWTIADRSARSLVEIFLCPNDTNSWIFLISRMSSRPHDWQLTTFTPPTWTLYEAIKHFLQSEKTRWLSELWANTKALTVETFTVCFHMQSQPFTKKTPKHPENNDVNI